MEKINQRIKTLLREKQITTLKFEEDTRISRRILYDTSRIPHKSTLMGIAYYLGITLEDLVSETDMETIL